MKICPKCQTRYDVSARFCSVDSEVLLADASVRVGTTLDGIFVLEQLLGEGAMGAVYRARHVALGDTVAIKVLKLSGGDQDKWLRRFQREGRAARRFRHPNVVAVHDLRVTPDGTAYMVQEFVEGLTLRQELRAGRMRLSRALAILGPLASALDAGHRNGVVHRDLKPDNVMIRWDEEGRPNVKLLDLGIAKLVGFDEVEMRPASTLTLAGQILGTPHYMSPEQWGEVTGDGSADIDGRADVYSMAVMTYELLTGTWPIRGLDVPSIRAGHLAGAVPSVCEIATHLPTAVDDVIRRGMALRRRDRFDSPVAFVEALAAVADGYVEPVDTVPTRKAISSANDPTAVLASADAESRRLNAGPGQPGPTAVWASGDATPGAINSEPTDAHVSSATEGLQQSYALAETEASVASPPARTLGTVDDTRAERRRSVAAAVVIAVVLAVGAVVAWSFRSSFSTSPPPDIVEDAAAAPVAPRPPDVVASVDIVRPDGSVRASSSNPEVTSGESVRVRLRTQVSEFIYLVVRGREGATTLLLGDKPPRAAGVATNRTEAGVDFVFPSPDGKLDRIDVGEDERTTPYTIIVSRESLASLGWPAEEAPHDLTLDEQASLGRWLASAVEASVSNGNASSGVLRVLRPEASASKPLVLTINVLHTAVPAP